MSENHSAREHRLNLRLDAAEYVAIQSAADAMGLAAGTFAREALVTVAYERIKVVRSAK